VNIEPARKIIIKIILTGGIYGNFY